jgi:hypothetical protein
MVTPLLHPVAVGSGAHMPYVMRAIGDEIHAWQDGIRSEEEAMLRIRLLIKAERARHIKEAPNGAAPPNLRVKRRSST